ncbi:MAG: hypothetical protein HLUCCA13_11415 [Halomonas sp. HL-48]|nr:MAG: hypothetical protein HLUCCA13_11415 [Halomonas sp. HL-48]
MKLARYTKLCMLVGGSVTFECLLPFAQPTPVRVTAATT